MGVVWGRRGYVVVKRRSLLWGRGKDIFIVGWGGVVWGGGELGFGVGWVRW
jgi:hypothetical protein